MTTLLTLVNQIKAELRDPDEYEIDIEQLIDMINAAATDAGDSGRLLPLEDDETLTLASGTHAYNVPASFSYVKELRLGTYWDTVIARHYWWMSLDGGNPQFSFDPSWENVYTAGSMKVVGWQRPTASYSALTDTVDVSLEAFLRTRAASFAQGFLATVSPEAGPAADQVRLVLRDRKFTESEAMLGRMPQQLKVLPTARYVLGR